MVKVWKGQQCIRTLSGHNDAVRALCMLDRSRSLIASASNDGSIRFWNFETGQQVGCMEKAHDAYIYTLIAIDGGRLMASAGEDRCIRIWDVQKKECIQVISVPAVSIWSVAELDGGDIACGTNDGYIYIYSGDPQRQLFDEALLEVYEEKLRTSSIPKTTMESLKGAKIFSSDKLDEAGQRPGEHVLIQSGSKVEAYQWDGQIWVKIGDVVDEGETQKPEYLGQNYDYVFDVQIEDGAGSLKLPYNLSENPYTAAQRFIADNQLKPEYVDQIVDFILKNTNQMGTSEPIDPYQMSVAPTKISFKDQPVKLSSANLDGILKKIAEFNSETDAPLLMAPVEQLVAYLLKQTKTRPENLAAIFEVFSHWPTENLFPVLDLVRVSILDEHIADQLSEFVVKLCATPLPAIHSNSKVSLANATMQLRIIVNALQSKHLTLALDDKKLALAKSIRALSTQLIPKEPLLAHQAIFNMALAFRTPFEPDFGRFLIALILERLPKLQSEYNSEAALLLLSALHVFRLNVPKVMGSGIIAELTQLKGTEVAPLVDRLISEL